MSADAVMRVPQGLARLHDLGDSLCQFGTRAVPFHLFTHLVSGQTHGWSLEVMPDELLEVLIRMVEKGCTRFWIRKFRGNVAKPPLSYGLHRVLAVRALARFSSLDEQHRFSAQSN